MRPIALVRFLSATVTATIVAGCASMGGDHVATVINSETVKQLQGRDWQLKSLTIDGRDVIMDLDANMTIRFAPDGKVGGYGSVNQYSSTYTFTPDGKLQWGGPGFITTRKAGPPELMEKERSFLDALRKTSRAVLNGHALQLQSEDGSTALPFVEAGM